MQPSYWDSPSLRDVNFNYRENLKSLGKSCSEYPFFPDGPSQMEVVSLEITTSLK